MNQSSEGYPEKAKGIRGWSWESKSKSERNMWEHIQGPSWGCGSQLLSICVPEGVGWGAQKSGWAE